MSTNTSSPAWVERSDGARVSILNTCSVGRSPSNGLVLCDNRVSRHHALIRLQADRQYWLVDLDSSNGTFVNRHRITQPVPLRDGDQIRISHFCLTFHQAQDRAPEDLNRPASDKTIVETTVGDCWLLVLDIEDSTELLKRLSAEQLSLLIGGWFTACKNLIEANEGNINKYLGDGLFAYWRESVGAETSVARTVTALRELQAGERPRFRVVLHFGSVFTGGVASLGEESLSGPDVHFVFRMERLAALLGEPRLASEAAWSRARSILAFDEAGHHQVPGFGAKHRFFSF
jgi:pSer/pThr/pTyr-binding forkhead associated (FHA) protein